MWNATKAPSIRELAARQANNQTATATELARIRDEQRALQRALEAEQSARLDAVAALHDRWTAHTQEVSARLNAGVDASNVTHDALEDARETIDALRAAVDSLTARLDVTLADVADLRMSFDSLFDSLAARLDGALADVADLRARLADVEGQDEIPAADAGAPETLPEPVEAALPVGGDTNPADGPLLRNRMYLHDPDPAPHPLAEVAADGGAPAVPTLPAQHSNGHDQGLTHG